VYAVVCASRLPVSVKSDTSTGIVGEPDNDEYTPSKCGDVNANSVPVNVNPVPAEYVVFVITSVNIS